LVGASDTARAVSPERLRAALIAALIAAAVANVVGMKAHSRFVDWLSVVFFIAGVFLYAWWRREVLRRRRARVLDREAKTASDETRSSPDQ
jgi:Flp pilus assembly protein TadB